MLEHHPRAPTRRQFRAFSACQAKVYFRQVDRAENKNFLIIRHLYNRVDRAENKIQA